MEEDILYSEDGAVAAGDAESPTDKYLLFMSDGLLFGTRAEYVVEIITNHAVTPVPLVPDYIRGIINLRGQILPLVDIRLLLGHPPAENDCIIILNIDGTMVGILVDTVLKMMDIEKASILSAPPQHTQAMVSGMCSLEDGQTMLVFDCPQILSNT